jgi:glycogen operon protein
VNFVTCHDGFTLNDLVSYDQKHNEANGEDNRDGTNDNRSWNCSVEGPSNDPVVERLRNRQVKNFLTVTLLSLGTPMLLMADEVRRSQNGNNNAYCQDNEISWLNWNLVNEHADLLRFTSLLISRRLLRDVTAERERKSLTSLIHGAKKGWHGIKLNQPDWNDHSHSLALSAEIRQERLLVYLILNAYWKSISFELPLLENSANKKWHRWIDTYLESPQDIVDWKTSPTVDANVYTAGPHSVVVLYTQDESGL